MFCEYVGQFKVCQHNATGCIKSTSRSGRTFNGRGAGRARISRAGKSGDTIQARPLLFSSCVQFRSSSTFFILTAFSISTVHHLIYIMVSNHSPFNSASSHIYGTIQVYSLCRYASSDARVERTQDKPSGGHSRPA